MRAGALSSDVATSRRRFLHLMAAGLGGTLLPDTAALAEEDSPPASGKLVFRAGNAFARGPLEGVFSFDLATGAWTRVFAEGSPPARLSPDGRTLAFLRAQPPDEDQAGLWAVDIERGGEPRKLSDLGGVPCWSPDGRELIVTGGRPQERSRWETWRLKADGSGRTRLPLDDNTRVIDWSRDGRRLLAASRATNGYAVSIMNPDGTGARTLTAAVEYAVHRFSPDGRRVVYPKQDGNRFVFSLWILDVEDGEPERIIEGREDRSPFFACWSPDGKWLAVDLIANEVNNGELVSRSRHIEIVDPQGRSRRKLELPHDEPVPVDWC